MEKTRRTYKWDLPESIEKRIGSKTFGKQRNIFEEDHLMIILHEVPVDDHREHCVFMRYPDGKLWCNGRDTGKAQLKGLLQNYQTSFDELDDKGDEAKTASDHFEVIEKLVPINRACKNLSQTLKQARDYVPDDEVLLEMRDWAYELERSFEILLADSKLTLEFKIAQKGEEQVQKANLDLDAQHKLNMLAGFTFPIMSIATIFGMNLQHGLENESIILFWCTFLCGLGIGYGTRYWILKK